MKPTAAIVIGAGPAGLMAADELSDRGVSVTVIDAKPTLGRKLLMAGKSGLNLTKDEPFDAFLANYGSSAAWLRPMLTAFSNQDVVQWANDLGQETFTGSTNRVFPRAMKSSPLLRAWLARLSNKGVQVQTKWRWLGWDGVSLSFETPEGPVTCNPNVTVLALGGASWSRLGSDGAWAGFLAAKGTKLAPFKPSNMGFCLKWSPHMEKYFGQPVKNACLIAGSEKVRGEFVVSAKGIEGGGIYSVSSALREGAKLAIDLLPDIPNEAIISRLSRHRGKNSLSNHLRKTLRLDPLRIALLQEFARPLPDDPTKLAKIIKCLPVPLLGPRPLDEAISTAGGVPQSELGLDLMLKATPGVFCAGEMLDWEAPTGGYLLSACLATGRWAGQAAAEFLDR